jgi:CHAT domain-containing protein
VARKYADAESALKGLISWNETARSEGLSGPPALTRGTDCPAHETWLRLAAGLIDDERVEARYVAHAAQCDWCGKLLRESMEDLAQDVTTEEEAALDKLPSASPHWPRSLAKKLMATSRTSLSSASAPTQEKPAQTLKPREPKAKGKPHVGWWTRFAFATAGLVAAVAAGWPIWQKLNPDPSRLLAKAYTEQRTLELRIPNAEYGPMRVQRGSEASRLNRPSALLDAEALISHKLAAQPENPSFLHMRGRAELMDWKYDAAIETLKHAHDLDPNSLSLKIDLASAYFERAEDTEDAKRSVDYQMAVELLGQVLAKTPDDPAALFNRAIVYDRVPLYHQAIEDWEHYLRVDRQGSWTGEARQRLEETRKKNEEHDRRSSEPLLQPEAVKQNVSASDESTWAAVDERVEDYLDVAITDWLPKAFPSSAQGSVPGLAADAHAALARLAVILEKRHLDHWLAEMNATRPGASWSDALAGLAAAVQYNEAGKADEAGVEAGKAANMFRRAGSMAGYLRAELELAYALHRSFQGQACLAVIDSLSPKLSSHHYRWMESQALLEKSVCSNMANDLAGAETSLEKALSSSRVHGYLALYLRALGFSATEKWSVKRDYAGSWAQDRLGLSYFWNGTFPWLRAYNFYQDLAASSESAGFREAAYSLRKEAASIDAQMDDETRHAIAHFMLGKTASAAGRTKEAQKEFSLAEIAFGRLPQTASNQGYRLYSNIQLAELEGDQGSFGQALALLTHVRADLSSFRNTPNEADFYQVLGEVNRRKGAAPDAEAAFRSAIGLVQTGFASVGSEADRRAMLSTVSKSYRGLVELRLAAHNPQEALEAWEEYRGWTSSPSPHPAFSSQAASLMASTQKAPDVTTIIYAVLNNRIAIWTFDAKDFTWASVDVDPQELEQTARRFSEQCSSRTSDIEGLRHNAARLYRLLVRPIEPHLRKGSTLVIEADSVLDHVPMEALLNEGGEYLAERFAVVYSPGLQRYRNLRRDEGITRDTSALIVNPAFSKGASHDLLPIISDSRREAEIVRKSFSHVQSLNGADATWAALQKDLPAAAVFHFVGHGVSAVDQSSVMLTSSTGNILDPVGPVRLSTLDMQSLRLAVLSACSTGRADEDGIAGPNTLVGVFLQANVPHIVASRWDVDSGITVEFMGQLYKTLLEKVSPGRAVQLAALNIRHNTATAHPYFWAGFVAFGHS